MVHGILAASPPGAGLRSHGGYFQGMGEDSWLFSDGFLIIASGLLIALVLSTLVGFFRNFGSRSLQVGEQDLAAIARASQPRGRGRRRRRSSSSGALSKRTKKDAPASSATPRRNRSISEAGGLPPIRDTTEA